MFDGVPYSFEPGQELTLPDDVARHLRKRSLISDNPVTGVGVFALAIKGIESEDPVTRPMEILDREGTDLPKVQYVTIANDVRNDGSATKSALDTDTIPSDRSTAGVRRV
jgi:hypothetical protein